MQSEEDYEASGGSLLALHAGSRRCGVSRGAGGYCRERRNHDASSEPSRDDASTRVAPARKLAGAFVVEQAFFGSSQR
jgi:hypothetical protein